jgi:hypothetical protein
VFSFQVAYFAAAVPVLLAIALVARLRDERAHAD